MRLFIIRHAESANNSQASKLEFEEYLTRRFEDPPLSALGERQAEALGHHVAEDAHPESREERRPGQPLGYGFTHLYCSPMLRSLQTAEPLARSTGLRPEVWIDIHERGGIFRGNPRTGAELVGKPGLTRAEIRERFSSYTVPESIAETGWWNREYEDASESFGRAIRVARALRDRAEEGEAAGANEAIALVTHGGFIDSLLKALFNKIPDMRIFYQHYNAAITRVDFRKSDLMIRYVNRTRHLPPDMFSV